MNRADRDAALIWDMLQAANDISDFLADQSLQEFTADRMLCLAVERCLQILGEAARHVSTAFQTRHTDIPWRRMIGMRNILAHDYGEIDLRIIFDTASVEVPAVATMLAGLTAKS